MHGKFDHSSSLTAVRRWALGLTALAVSAACGVSKVEPLTREGQAVERGRNTASGRTDAVRWLPSPWNGFVAANADASLRYDTIVRGPPTFAEGAGPRTFVTTAPCEPWWSEVLRPGLDSVTYDREPDADALRCLAATGVEQVALSSATPPGAVLSVLTRVRALALTGVDGETLAQLGALPWLHTLSFGNSRVGVDNLARLPVLPGLRKLELRDPSLPDGGLRYLERLPGLRELDLRGAMVTDAGARHLAGMRGLESLVLVGPYVTDAGLVHLAGLTRLRALDLQATQTSDAGLIYLAGLSELEELRLDLTNVRGPGLAHLVGLQRLRVLDLAQTRVDDEALVHIAQMPTLEELDLLVAPVTSRGMALIAGHPALRFIELSGTQVDDEGLAHLVDVGTLARVDLDATDTTAARSDLLGRWCPKVLPQLACHRERGGRPAPVRSPL